jgi:hypothetical protein
MPLAISVIGIALSLVGSIVAVTVALTQMKSNISFLDKQQQKSEDEEGARHDKMESRDVHAVRQITELLVLVKAFMAEQAVVNKVVSETMQGLVRKLDAVEHRVTEVAAVSSLLVEVLKRDRPSLGGS